MDFFKYDLKKKQMNYGVVYGMDWVWGIFFNPIDFLGLINLQPLVALKTSQCKVWIEYSC